MVSANTQTPETLTGTVPTVGQRADALLQEFDGLLERLWQLRIWDVPEDMVDEVTERVQRWVDGFERLCYCNRSFRYCVCP